MSASPSAQPLHSGLQNASLLNGNLSGQAITENCGIVKKDGSLWSYTNQTSANHHFIPTRRFSGLFTVVVANDTNLPFTSSVSGVFGLGTNGYSGQLSDTVFGRWFPLHPNATNFTYGMALNFPPQTADAGTLHWTASDSSAFAGDISWISTVSADSSYQSSGFAIGLNEWDFTADDVTTSVKTGGVAVVDPYFTNIYVPRNFSRQICQCLFPSLYLNPEL